MFWRVSMLLAAYQMSDVCVQWLGVAVAGYKSGPCTCHRPVPPPHPSGGVGPASVWGQGLAPISRWTRCGKSWTRLREGAAAPPLGPHGRLTRWPTTVCMYLLANTLHSLITTSTSLQENWNWKYSRTTSPSTPWYTHTLTHAIRGNTPRDWKNGSALRASLTVVVLFVLPPPLQPLPREPPGNSAAERRCGRGTDVAASARLAILTHLERDGTRPTAAPRPVLGNHAYQHTIRIKPTVWRNHLHRGRHVVFNPLAPKLDIYSLAHHSCKMWIFYEPRRVTLGNTRHFVEE